MRMPETEIVSLIYYGVQYDISKMISKHPGGAEIIYQLLEHKKDVSEYFKAIHSRKAEEQLVACRQIRKVERSKMQKAYAKIQQRIKRYYKPNYFYEYLYIFLILSEYLLALFLNNSIHKAFFLSLAQISAFWAFHSQSHLDAKYLKKVWKVKNAYTKLLLTLLGGISTSWWRKKHLKHHLFTNSDPHDQDINASSSVLAYPFLISRWRVSSLLYTIQHMEWGQICCLLAHYYLLTLFTWTILFYSLLVSSFIVNIITAGNHEKETIFVQLKEEFINHQLKATTDYTLINSQLHSFFNFLTGGFIYHTEHHLFPKVPFYYLPKVRRLVVEELGMLNRSLRERDVVQ